MALILFLEFDVGRKAKTHEQFVAEMAVKHPDITVVGEYIVNSTKVIVQHKCGHQWSITPNNILCGQGCPKCAIEATKKTHKQFVTELFELNPKLTVLGEYVCSSAKLQIQCKCGHRWSVKPNSLLQGTGCPKCAIEATKKTHKQFVNELFELNPDITVLGEYANHKEKLLVQHTCGHQWSVAPNNLLKGNGCPKCHMEATKKTHKQFVNELFELNSDITVLGEYVNNKAKLLVQHVCGHQWSVRPRDLLQGTGCPKCFIEATKKTHKQFVAELAEVNPDITVRGEYVNNCTKLQVQHTCGHQWSASPNKLLRGHGCPKCAKSGYKSNKIGFFYSYAFEGYLGFGITNVPKQRSKAHKTTFKKLGIEATLIQTFSGDGKAIQDLETHLKRTLPIVNTGVEGFKTEAILWEDRELLFKACEDFQRDQAIQT